MSIPAKKKLFLIMTLLLSVSTFCYAQRNKIVENIKLADSSLVKSQPKIIILHDDKKVKILVTQESFIFSCNAWFDHSKAEEYKMLVDKLNNHNQQIFITENFKLDENLKPYFEDIIQSLLLENLVLAYNKKTKKLEKEVRGDFYDLKNNNFGLEYKSENKILILKTTDYSCF